MLHSDIVPEHECPGELIDVSALVGSADIEPKSYRDIGLNPVSYITERYFGYESATS